MKYINIISLIIISFIISSCQTNNFEQENDAVFKSIKKTYTLNSDGSVNYQYQHKLKYITHYSFNRAYGESFIVYNPKKQKLKINKAETTMADGKIVPSPENAFNEVLPRFAAGAPAFNHLREMVVTHTGLEPECIVDFDYEVYSEKGYLPYLNDNVIIQQNAPIEKMNIIVRVPHGTNFNFKLINSEIKPVIKEKEEFVVYNWEFNNIETLSHEPNQSHDQSFLPRLIFSSVNMIDALKNLYTENDLILSDDIKNKVRKRIFGKKNEINIIRELQQIAGKEINDFNIPIEYSAYSIRPLSDVWNSNGGTNLEKTLLFNELIKYIGFESKIILAIHPNTYDKEVGNLIKVGHPYVSAQIEGEELILSINPNQNNNLIFDINDNVIISIDSENVIFPDYVNEVKNDVKNAISASGMFQIDKDGNFAGKLKVEVSGAQSPYLNYLEDNSNAKDVIESIVSGEMIKDHQVIKFDNKGCEIHANIEGKEIWKCQGNYFFIDLLSSSSGIKASHLRTLSKERKTPLHLTYPVNESYDFKIVIPDGFEFVGPEVQKEIVNETGSVKVFINNSNNTIQVSKALKIHSQDILPGEYANFKTLMDLWNKNNYNEIIVKKTTE